MLDYDYFLALNHGVGSDSMTELKISEGRRRLREQLMTSVHYVPDAARNGERQGFIIVASDTYYKSKIEALPGETLNPGDIITSHGVHWLVYYTRITSPFQVSGQLWMCNHQFRWQNEKNVIVERWGVLDTGMYTSVKDGNATVMTADKQYKIYLPYDGETRKLGIDRRLAIGVMFHSGGRQVLNVQKITGVDPASLHYGANAHLLILNVRSDDYAGSADNLDLMICDYVPPEAESANAGFQGKVSGPAEVPVGSVRRYAADFAVAEWRVSDVPGVTFRLSDDTLVLRVANNEDLIGEDVFVSAYDAEGRRASARVLVTA